MATALRKRRFDQSGQTTLEYLMLMAVAAFTAYLVTLGPVATFADDMIARIRGALGNIAQNGELKPGAVTGPGQAGHPGDQARLKPLHL